MPSVKVLITGICGFAGSALARNWLAAEPGLKLHGMDNFIRQGSEINRIELQKSGVTLSHGDIRCRSDFDALPDVDWVVDAAANASVLAGVDGRTSSRQLIEHNLQGTINILEFCRERRAGFILMSTSRVYAIRPLAGLEVEVAGRAFRPKKGCALPAGLSPRGVAENFSTEAPVSLYGSTKLASEILALEYGETFNLPVWINRCGVLAGAGQFGRPDQGIFAYWINSWLQRRPLTYIGFGGRGHQVRDCLHPRDLVPLLRKQTTAAGAARPRIVNLGGGADNCMSLAELSAWCEARFGRHDVAADLTPRPFDIPWLVMDSSRAKEAWDWTPRTSLPDILGEIAGHAEQNPNWLQISGLV